VPLSCDVTETPLFRSYAADEAVVCDRPTVIANASTCDVAIVGAGPAGCAAAIQTAQNGLSVLLLEAQPFPRDRPGESLHPGIEALFDQLGVGDAVRAAGFLRHRGHWVRWGEFSRFQAFREGPDGPWLGFQAWRADLDSILMQRADAAGAGILQPCRAIAAIVEGARVVGLSSDAGEIRARFVIDAGGGRHWLHRQAGIPIHRASRRLIATYGYATGDCGGDPVLAGDPGGWTWTAQVRPDLVAWTQLGFAELRREPPQAIRSLTPAGPVRGADVTWRMLEACAGSGYFAIGDAASVLDPAASHGVLKAVMSGILAGDLIVRAVRGVSAEPAAAAAYQSWTREWFARDCRRLRGLYTALRDSTGDAHSASFSPANA
jgi:flavin-dependent dehydrogenase